MMIIFTTIKRCCYAGDVLQNPVIHGESFFYSQVFKKHYYIAAMFKYGHRFINSDSTNEWFTLLSRFRDSSVSAKDIETFHALIGGVLFPDEHHEASASESTVFRNLTCFANTIVVRGDPNKNLKHSYLQARRLDKIEQYYQNTVKAASTTQNESTSLPLSFCKKHIVILCSERCQQMAYNDLAKQRHDVNNSPSSTFNSVAEDLCRYANSDKPVTTPIYFTKDEMQDLQSKELNLKVGMYVSIANNSVGHYWVKNMKVKK
jgi:hypothetical protein